MTMNEEKMNDVNIGLVLDCADPEALAEFWAPALDYVNLGTAGAYVALLPNGKPGPKLVLQQVKEPKTVKNRMHFDIEVPDNSTEAARLVDLGDPASANVRAASTALPGSS